LVLPQLIEIYAQNTKNEVPKAISDQFHISVNGQYNLRESEDVF
jgi:hypothetical protein